MATQLAERRADPIAVVRQNLTAMAPEFQAALPAHITVEKFTRVAMTAIQNNPDLAVKADRRSLFGACVRLAQDGLLPDGREAAIVMFGDKAQAMPMIAGILRKIRQSGEVARVSAQVVYEHDEFVWHLGFDEDVTHNPPPLDKPRGKPIGAYATAVLKDGSRLLEVMTLDEIEKVRSVSRAKNNGPWVQWWGEMARKTVMRRLSKRLPMSTDLMIELDRDSSLPDEPIEHQPQPPAAQSRLDALEHHIEAEAEEVSEDVRADTVSEEAPNAEEGPADEQRGDAFTGEPSRSEAESFISSYTAALANAKNDAARATVHNRADELAAKLLREFPDLYLERLSSIRPDDAPEKRPADALFEQA